MASVSLLDSHKASGSVRWDGRPVKPTPKISSLPPELVNKIRELTAVR